jgi:hypothetical protein
MKTKTKIVTLRIKQSEWDDFVNIARRVESLCGTLSDNKVCQYAIAVATRALVKEAK